MCEAIGNKAGLTGTKVLRLQFGLVTELAVTSVGFRPGVGSGAHGTNQ